MVGPRLYTTAGLSDRTPAWALHIIEYTAPAPLLQWGRGVEKQTVSKNGPALLTLDQDRASHHHTSEPRPSGAAVELSAMGDKPRNLQAKHTEMQKQLILRVQPLDLADMLRQKARGAEPRPPRKAPLHRP